MWEPDNQLRWVTADARGCCYWSWSSLVTRLSQWCINILITSTFWSTRSPTRRPSTRLGNSNYSTVRLFKLCEKSHHDSLYQFSLWSIHVLTVSRNKLPSICHCKIELSSYFLLIMLWGVIFALVGFSFFICDVIVHFLSEMI